MRTRVEELLHFGRKGRTFVNFNAAGRFALRSMHVHLDLQLAAFIEEMKHF